jgi:thiol-disulfide isomerase/thioredoxin
LEPARTGKYHCPQKGNSMKRIATILFVVGLVILWMAGTSWAKVDWEVQKNLDLHGTPLDMATTPNGSRIFVLLKGGKILVCSPGGEISERIKVDPEAERIEISPAGDHLYISTRKGKLLLVSLDFISDINTSGDPVRGPANAPVQIIVFSDFQCPYCDRLEPLLSQVLAKYPRQVKLVFKQFPLNMHPFSRKAAAASLAAGEQGKFWEMHDRLFENARRLSDSLIDQMAKDLGLDMAKFKESLSDPSMQSRINEDIQDGYKAGVRGTPTVFIDGKLLRNRSLRGFEEMIEKDLHSGKKNRS